jgi:hypothetical protein
MLNEPELTKVRYTSSTSFFTIKLGFTWTSYETDYWCADEKQKITSWEAILAPLDMSWLPLLGNRDHHHQKKGPWSQNIPLNCLKISRWSLGLKFPSSNLGLWVTLNTRNRFLTFSSSIGIVIFESSDSYLAINLCFYCWKENLGLTHSFLVATSEIHHLHIHSLCCLKVVYLLFAWPGVVRQVGRGAAQLHPWFG